MKHLDWGFLVLLLCLSGCGANNALLREEVDRFTHSARIAGTAGETTYDNVIDADRKLRTTMLVLDPRCIPREFAGDALSPCSIGDTQVVRSATLSRKDLARQYAHLRFVESYVSALAKWAGDIEPKAGLAFTQARNDLKTVQDLFESNTKNLTEERTEAASDLFDFLTQVSQERRSADEIRAILGRDAVKVEAALRKLAKGLLQDDQFIVAAHTTSDVVQKITLHLGVPDAEVRATMLANLYAHEDWLADKEEVAQACEASNQPDWIKQYCDVPAAGLMAAAAVAHRDLTELAAERLNARQRARRTQLAWERFIATARLFVNLRTAY